MTLELHVPSGIRLSGEVKRARDILDRAIATDHPKRAKLMVGVVTALTVKRSTCFVSFSDKDPSTTAERAHAVCHIASIARELGAPSCKIAFESHEDWLRGLGLIEVNGVCQRPGEPDGA